MRSKPLHWLRPQDSASELRRGLIQQPNPGVHKEGKQTSLPRLADSDAAVDRCHVGAALANQLGVLFF
jgi:hypothetical protein